MDDTPRETPEKESSTRDEQRDLTTFAPRGSY
jgi:hypothetical protein